MNSGVNVGQDLVANKFETEIVSTLFSQVYVLAPLLQNFIIAVKSEKVSL